MSRLAILGRTGGRQAGRQVVSDAPNHRPTQTHPPPQVSTTVLELQRLLPRARFVYCSATGVSGERRGLSGEMESMPGHLQGSPALHGSHWRAVGKTWCDFSRNGHPSHPSPLLL